MIFGQPERYGDMLRRLAWTNFASAVLAAWVLTGGRPFKFAPFGEAAEVGGLVIPMGYLVAAGAWSWILRIVRLHDKISDLLRLRQQLDVHRVLVPLARGVGARVNEDLFQRCRHSLMRKTFYRYATIPAPIDDQLVRTALDQYAWAWVFMDATVTALLTSAALSIQADTIAVSIVALLVAFVCAGATGAFWRSAGRATDREVKAILESDERRREIAEVFVSEARMQSR